MSVLADRALLLRRWPFGESSLVVHLLTRRHGRVQVLAKGAYRATSRYFAVLDFFDTLELEWSNARAGDLGLLRAGTLVRRRRNAGDLASYRAAHAVLELAALAARVELEDGELFDLTEETLERLDRRTDPPALVTVVFELGFLQNLGLAPALEACAACGEPARAPAGGRVAFSAGAGGRLCRTHAAEARAAGRRVGTLPLAVIEAAAALSACTPANPFPHLDPGLLERVQDFVERFLGYHLETRPAGHARFLAVPNRNAPEHGEPPPFRAPDAGSAAALPSPPR